MPRFAVVAMVLLTAVIAAGAAGLWYDGRLPELREPDAASAPSSAPTASEQEPVERAASAIRAHDVAAVQQYRTQGGDPDAADAEGETLLNKAVLFGTPEILEALLAAGADPNLPGKNGLGPLAIAALAGRHAMLERLMRANAARAAAGATTGGNRGFAAAAGSTAADGTAAAAEAAPASHVPRTESAEAGVSSSGPSPASSVLASLAGYGAPQAAPPAESFASMAGLVVNPIARPLTPTPATAPAATSASEPAPQSPSPAGGSPTAGAAAVAGEAPQAWVSAAQKRLGQLGYYEGPVTGFAGPLTADAVKRYQAVAGIPQDGVVSADLLRRIGASVEAPREAPAPPAAPALAAAPAPAEATAAAGQAVDQAQAQAQNQRLQQVRNALGQEFNSATRPDALRQHCQANANDWVYDEAIGRPLFCRDVIGSPPR